MGAGVLVAVLIGILFLIAAPISFFILKYLGYKKLGIIVSLIMVSIVLIPFFLLYFESELYSKSDAKKDLSLINLALKDDFEISKSEISGMPEYYQFTDLRISQKDKQNIIKEIKNSTNFELRDSITHLRFIVNNQNSWEKDTTIVHNFQFKDQIIREVYIKKDGYIPINLKIEMKDNSDILKLERIED